MSSPESLAEYASQQRKTAYEAGLRMGLKTATRARELAEERGLIVVRALDIPQQPQRQDALDYQLQDVYTAAVRLGCYDAADWLNSHIVVPLETEGRVSRDD